jgi:hypothetical protein
MNMYSVAARASCLSLIGDKTEPRGVSGCLSSGISSTEYNYLWDGVAEVLVLVFLCGLTPSACTSPDNVLRAYDAG